MLLSTVSRFVFFNFPAAAHFQRLGAFSSASFSTSSFSLKCYCYYFTLPSTATATVCRATRLIVHDMLLSTVYCSTYLHTVMICYCQLLSTSTVRPTINCTLFFLRQLSTTSYGFWFCGHLSGGSSVSCGWFVCLCPAVGLCVCVLRLVCMSVSSGFLCMCGVFCVCMVFCVLFCLWSMHVLLFLAVSWSVRSWCVLDSTNATWDYGMTIFRERGDAVTIFSDLGLRAY